MQIKKNILIIEEDEQRRLKMTSFLSLRNFLAAGASTMSAAFKAVETCGCDQVIVRIHPDETLKIDKIKQLKDIHPELCLIILEESGMPKWAVSLLDHGIADYVIPADNMGALYSVVKNQLEKERLRSELSKFTSKLDKIKSKQIENSRRAHVLEEIYNTTLENLMTALDIRDVETFGHSRTVAKYSQALAQIMGIRDKQKLDNIRMGALLHDVGKIAIPDSILKKPGPLSPLEWEKIRLHPALGFGLIKEIKLVEEVGNIILFHHERYDGKGYPQGLTEEKIPVEARIFAVADALDAITSHRPYRESRSFSMARKEIQRNTGSQFDPQVVEAFNSIAIEKWERIRFKTTQLLPSFEEMLELQKF